MFLFNPLDYLFDFAFTPYIFVAFALLGVMLLLRKLIFGR